MKYLIYSRARNLVNFRLFVFILLLFVVGLRVYKAFTVGVIGDEIRTYNRYTSDVLTALTHFESTNNHLLNSVCIAVLRQLGVDTFANFLRIPALVCSVFFCLAIFNILVKVVSNKVVFVSMLIFILLNRFVFDLSILARGYSFGLAAIFLELAHLVNCKDSFNKLISWKTVSAVIILNVIAVVGISPSLIYVSAINIVYFGYVLQAGRSECRLRSALYTVAAVSFMSLLLTLMLYWNVIPQFLDNAKSFGDTYARQRGVYKYLTMVLFDPLISMARVGSREYVLTRGIGYVFLIYLFITGLVLLFRLKAGKVRDIVCHPVIMVLGISVIFLAVQRYVFNVSLGFPRNNVFILVLFMLSISILLDKVAAIDSLGRNVSNIGMFFVLALLSVNHVRLSTINIMHWEWVEQSMPWQLVHQLHDISADKEWRFKLGENSMKLFEPIFKYYDEFGYKSCIVNDDSYDLYFTRDYLEEKEGYGLSFFPEKYDMYHCHILVNPAPKKLSQ